MPKWRFWEKSERAQGTVSQDIQQPARFSARPRTDLLSPSSTRDSARAAEVERLRRRREAVMFEVQQSESASAEANPWLERVVLLDQAIEAVREEQARVSGERGEPGRALEPISIRDLAVETGPPPAVTFRIGEEEFRYTEALDWAERGRQIARSELERQSGDPSGLVPAGVDGTEREALAEHLASSLFAFATDLRDRALAGQPMPEAPSLSDLAQPDPEGGWLSWGGHSAAGAAKRQRLRELESEEQRLLGERAREIEEMERLAERLPIALRRLAEIDAEIEALGA